jgi:hypothetical protein
MIWSPFLAYPREMGFPSRACIVYSLPEMLSRVNKWNGKMDIFTSLYALSRVQEGRQDFDSFAQVDHIFWDLDDHGSAYENVKKLQQYLVEQNYLHCINFSGGGFHVYVAAHNGYRLKNKRVAIDNAMTSISRKLGLKIGIRDSDDIDARTVGNVSQLVRLPNTYNIKRKRFCIPLTYHDLKLPFETIKTMAEKQRFIGEEWFFGVNFLDLEPYDGAEKIRNITVMSVDTEDSLGIENINFDAFKPCIKALLNKGTKLNHCERYLIISYLREQGIPIRDTIEILRKYLPSSNFYHCIREEKQPIQIYSRADLIFPSCEKMKADGYCTNGTNCT